MGSCCSPQASGISDIDCGTEAHLDSGNTLVSYNGWFSEARASMPVVTKFVCYFQYAAWQVIAGMLQGSVVHEWSCLLMVPHGRKLVALGGHGPSGFLSDCIKASSANNVVKIE